MIRLLLAFFLSFAAPLVSETPEDAPVNHTVNTHLDTLQRELELSESEDTNKFFHEFVRMLTILGFIVGGLLFVSWMMKRMMNTRIEQMNVSSAIKVLERRAISTKSAVYLLEVNDHRIVVGDSQNGLTLLAAIPANRRFEDILDQVKKSDT